MIQEIFIAALKAGLPVGLASYALVLWALKKDHLGSVVSVRGMEKEIKRLNRDKESKKSADPVHRKWLAFGGGFYGVVGLLTYAVVEMGEVRDFFTQFTSIGDLIARISPDMFIRLIIDAFKNFIVAIAWPVFWLSEIRSNHVWVWFVVAYAAYWAGARLALRQAMNPDGIVD